MIILWFLVFFVLSNAKSDDFTGHTCVHDDVFLKNSLEITLSNENSRRGEYELVPIRFHFDTSFLEEDLKVKSHVNLDPGSVERVIEFLHSDIFTNANEVFGKILRVANLRPELRLPEKTFECLRDVPDHLLGKSFDKDLKSDYVVIMNSVPSNFCDIAIAFSTPCMRIQEYRPVLGMINLCPQYINLVNTVSSNSLTFNSLYDTIVKQVIVHELFHDLGFSSDYFKEFEDGKVEKMMYRNQKRMFYSHKISNQKISEHFGCDNVKGAELENMERKGTYRSHLDSRVFYTELMDGSGALQLYMSPISFSILESSGWYYVDYSEIPNDFQFGRDEGCSFLEDDCIQYEEGDLEKKRPIPLSDDFCVSQEESRCLRNLEGFSECKIMNYKNFTEKLVPEEQYFGDEHLGGLKSTDGCPVFFLKGECQLFIDDEKPVPKDWSPNDVVRKCVEMKTWEEEKERESPDCVWMKCNFRYRTIQIFDPVGQTVVECEEPGVWKGNIKCPVFQDACEKGRIGVMDFRSDRNKWKMKSMGGVFFFLAVALLFLVVVMVIVFGVSWVIIRKWRGSSEGGREVESDDDSEPCSIESSFVGSTESSFSSTDVDST